MKTLYKSTPRIAAAIVGIMALSTSAAVALTSNPTRTEIVPQVESLGRFVVTPRWEQDYSALVAGALA